MFKITGAAMLAGILLADLSGAELKAVQNKVQYGKTAFHLQKGRISVTDPRLQLLVIVPHFTTNGKKRWYSFTNPDAAPKLVSSENNTWKFQAAIPLDADQTVLKAAETFSMTPFGTIETEISWEKPANPKDLLETACFFTIPMKALGDNKLMVDSQELQIVKETKYGWFSRAMENPSFVLYPGVEGREFTLAFQGKCRVSIGTVKNSGVTVRVITDQSPIKYTITPK